MEQIFDYENGKGGTKGRKRRGGRERKENKIKRLKVKCLINDTYGNICIYGRVVEMICNKKSHATQVILSLIPSQDYLCSSTVIYTI
jgi:hypothetical protein